MPHPDPRATPSSSPAPGARPTLLERSADRLAHEVKRLVERGVIDARSPAGDALLDYGGVRHGEWAPISSIVASPPVGGAPGSAGHVQEQHQDKTAKAVASLRSAPLSTASTEDAREATEHEPRVRDGQALHDGGIYDPSGCPRGLGHQCSPLSRIASPGYESFMCCGQTSSAPVPTDRLRLCIKSTHDTGVDLLVNLDERDTVHTASVLMGGLASLGSVKITATDSEAA